MSDDEVDGKFDAKSDHGARRRGLVMGGAWWRRLMMEAGDEASGRGLVKQPDDGAWRWGLTPGFPVPGG